MNCGFPIGSSPHHAKEDCPLCGGSLQSRNRTLRRYLRVVITRDESIQQPGSFPLNLFYHRASPADDLPPPPASDSARLATIKTKDLLRFMARLKKHACLFVSCNVRRVYPRTALNGLLDLPQL